MVLTPFQVERLCISRLRSKGSSFEEVSDFLRGLESYMTVTNRMKCMKKVGISYGDISKIFGFGEKNSYARINEDWYPRKVRFLLGNFKSDPYISNSDLWTSDFAYLLGAFMHQNHNSGGLKKNIKNNSEERVTKVAKSVEAITGVIPDINMYNGSFEVYIPESLGKRVDDVTRRRRIVPWDVFSNPEYRRRFLEGFYSLRRRTGKSQPKSIEFATSDSLAKQVSLLLVREGLLPRITENHRGCTEVVVSHADDVDKLLKSRIIVEDEDVVLAEEVVRRKRNPGQSSKTYFRAKTLLKRGSSRERVAKKLNIGSSSIHYWLNVSPPRSVKRLEKILQTKTEIGPILKESRTGDLVEFLDLIGIDFEGVSEPVLMDLEYIIPILRDYDDFGISLLEDFEFRTNERFRKTENPDYLVLGSMAILKESLFRELSLSLEDTVPFEGRREEVLGEALKQGFLSTKELELLIS